MKFLKIKNNGVLDIRLVALMGGTTKSNDEYKIGQFGTGLKYTLAFLHRNNLFFKIFAGEDEVKIHTETEIIRDEVFEIICINGQRTSITTKMGEDWQAWMIVRELWCNALDEGGAERDETESVVGEKDCTSFFIQIDKQVRAVLDNWCKYFIHDQEPIFSNQTYTLYPAGENLCLYKKGVLIKEVKGEKSVFSYDIGNAEINELREYNGALSYPITHALCDADEKAAAYFLENLTEKHFEGGASMDYNWYKSFNQSWRNVIGSGKLIYQKVLDDIKARGGTPDETGLIVIPKNLYKKLTEQFEGIGALQLASKIGDFYEDYDEAMENKIKQGLTILEHCGYVMHPELEFVYGFFEDKTVLAKVSLNKKTVYISRALLQKPLFTIVGMLVEENEHFNTGMEDHTREFQQHFIDLYTRQLLASNKVEI